MGVNKQINISSQCNSVNLTFVLPEAYEVGTLQVVLSGATLTKDVNYTEQPNANSVLFVLAPATGATLVIFYNARYTFMSGIAGFTTDIMRQSYLFGLPLTDRAGNPITNAMLQQKLDIAVAYFQRDLDIYVVPTVVKSTAVLGSSTVPPENVTYDVLEDPYDYDARDYFNWGYMRLRKTPVISVERMRLIYPTGQLIIQYPTDWIKIYHKVGQIHIVPSAMSYASYPIIGGQYLPLMSGYLNRNIPALINVDYTVGFKQGQIPADFADVVYKKAAIDVLRIAGNAMAPGIASISTGADGLNESTSLAQGQGSTMFGGYIKEYKQDIDDFLTDFRETQQGVKWVSA